MENIKHQLKLITIQGLRITDMRPEDLKDDAPLLGGDLGIDSIDILQLILVVFFVDNSLVSVTGGS